MFNSIKQMFTSCRKQTSRQVTKKENGPLLEQSNSESETVLPLKSYGSLFHGKGVENRVDISTSTEKQELTAVEPPPISEKIQKLKGICNFIGTCGAIIFTWENIYNITRDILWAAAESYEAGADFKSTENSAQQTAGQTVICISGLTFAFITKCIIYQCYLKKDVPYFEDFRTISACTAIIAPWNSIYDLVIQENDVKMSKIALASFASAALSSVAEAIVVESFNTGKVLYDRKRFNCKTKNKNFALVTIEEFVPNFTWQFLFSVADKAKLGYSTAAFLAVASDLSIRTLYNLSGLSHKIQIKCGIIEPNSDIETNNTVAP